MSEISRNKPCPCGSGKKFKHCCGAIAPATSAPQGSPPAEALARFDLELRRHEAKEHRRRLMQGLGRPIISLESHGYRLVAVGNEVLWSKKWGTFTDFLFDYVKHAFTVPWGQRELAKREAEQHPLLDWGRRIDAFRKGHAHTRQGKFYSAPRTGVVRAVLGLAYDLYLCAHNIELPALLMTRLRNAKTFEGALYEAYVIGTFAKAGFAIEFEDESDSTVSHCEFTATHKETGRKFSVEAKAVASTSRRAGHSTEPARVRNLLYQALRKKAAHDRIIFIELNRTQTISANGEPDWVKAVTNDLTSAEAELTIRGEPAPKAYLFVTNRAYMHALDEPDCGEAGIVHGFKIPEFPQGRGCASMLEVVEARDRHIEPHWLLKAMQSRQEIPSTFDDRFPEEVFAIGEQQPPLRIGDTYLVPDGSGQDAPGVLEDGCVLDTERTAYGIYRLASGQRIIVTAPLSDAELAIYRRSPDTFFGIVKNVGGVIKQPIDGYDFSYEVYSRTSKEKLLEFMVNWPDIKTLRSLPQADLAKIYCARLAEGMWRQSQRTHQ